MTFQEYIQDLQDQFDRDNGEKGFPGSVCIPLVTSEGTRENSEPFTQSTKDVCEAIASFDYQPPNSPCNSYQKTMVEAWYKLNTGIKYAKDKVDENKVDFEPLLDRGRDLKGNLLKLWDKVQDLPEKELEGVQTSKILNDAASDLADMAQQFLNEVYRQLDESETISNYSRDIGSRGSKAKDFTLNALQECIEEIRSKRATVTKAALRKCLKIDHHNTFNKRLRALNIDDDELKSAMKGDIRLT